jgi:hypothetical protein
MIAFIYVIACFHMTLTDQNYSIVEFVDKIRDIFKLYYLF